MLRTLAVIRGGWPRRGDVPRRGEPPRAHREVLFHGEPGDRHEHPPPIFGPGPATRLRSQWTVVPSEASSSLRCVNETRTVCSRDAKAAAATKNDGAEMAAVWKPCFNLLASGVCFAC